MDGVRRTGVWLAGAAVVLWIVFAAMMLSTSDEDGANIGGGLVGLLAMAVSVAAAVVLIVEAASWDVRAPAGLSVLAWIGYLVLAVYGTAPRAVAYPLLAVGVVLLAASAVQAARPQRRSGAVRH